MHIYNPILGQMLPDIDFFIPKESFIDYMAENYNNIIEVGAGRGLFAEQLYGKGVGIEAYDLCHRLGSSKIVTTVDIFYIPFDAHSTIIVCRPCHGFFLEELFKKCFDEKVKKVLYVGLKKNFDIDINPNLYKYKIIKENVGEDQECLLEITKK